MEKKKIFDYIKHGFTQDDVYIRLTPKNKKSVNMMIQLYNVPVNEPGHRFVQVNEMYRWGYGYMEGDTLDYPNLILPQNGQTYCDPTVGHGSDLDDLCAVDFWYNGDPDDDDGRSGLGWVYDYQDTWQIEDEQIIIDRDVKYDIVSKTEYNKVFIEDYKPDIDENI
jgi:hypothetical protein